MTPSRNTAPAPDAPAIETPEPVPDLLAKAKGDRLRHLAEKAAAALAEGDAARAGELWEEARAAIGDGGAMPDTVCAADLEGVEIVKPPEQIAGVLYQGGKLLLSAPSKARKTFNLINLAFAICEGGRWMGRFQCARGAVLFLNYELQGFAFTERLQRMAARQGRKLPGNFHLWNLRERRCDLRKDAPAIIGKARALGASAIFIDPVYKGMGGRDENKAADVEMFLWECAVISHATGASIIMAHHFAKGSAGAKNGGDKASGSGVWAREPDALFEMSPVERDGADMPDAFFVECRVRNFAPVEPFGVRWDDEREEFNPDAGIEAGDMKGADKRKRGRPTNHTPETLRGILDREGPITSGELLRRCEGIGIGRSRFFELSRAAKSAGIIREANGLLCAVSPETFMST